MDLRLGVLLPLFVIAVGAIIGLSQLDTARRNRWLVGSGWQTALRLGLGVVVTAGGILALVTRDVPVSQTWDIVIAVLVVLLGAGLLVAPWGVRVMAELRSEQAARERADERADMAAHLHDSVLQTLALIQVQGLPDAADFNAMKPTKPDPGTLCARCHEAIAGKPKTFPQVDTKEHSSGVECKACHDPHQPKPKV